ncbi:MAG: hypothetical protein GX053_10465 [Tissierella sp.]|nr:hypothetical protein [Tissierella sp.]
MKFPSVNNIISLDKAKEAYEEEIGLKLVYKSRGGNIIRSNSEEANNYYYLAYTTIGNSKGIDAKTGKSINLLNYSIYSSVERATEDSL